MNGFERWSLERYFKPKFLQRIRGEILEEETVLKDRSQFSLLLFPFKRLSLRQTERLEVSCADLFCHCVFTPVSLTAPRRYKVKKDTGFGSDGPGFEVVLF